MEEKEKDYLYPLTILLSLQKAIEKESEDWYSQIPNYLPKVIWVYKIVDYTSPQSNGCKKFKDLVLVNNRPFPTIESASKYLQVARSTVVSILDKSVAMSSEAVGFYCFSNPLIRAAGYRFKIKPFI